MRTVQIVTIKPVDGEVEYGVREDGEWVVHGVVMALEVGPETTGAALVAAATADAQGRGLVGKG